MTNQDWEQAYPVFLWWTHQSTPESTRTAWRLLDRLVEEERVSCGEPHLQTFWLNRIVEVSRKVFVSKKNPRLVVGPLDWLDRIDLYGAYLPPNHATYGMIMDSLTRWSDEPTVELVESLLDKMYASAPMNPEVRPDVTTYNAVLYAWANSGLDEAPKRAERVFQRMVEKDIVPDVVSFNTLISVYARSWDPSAAQQAESILRDMQENERVEINTIAYNTVLTAWKRSRQQDSALRAENLLHEMTNLYENGNDAVKPDAQSFGVVIRKQVYVQNVERADVILRKMTEMYRARDLEVEPKMYRKLYDNVIDEWANVYHPQMGDRAESLLRDMYELSLEGNTYMKPCLGNFMAVIAAWTKRSHPDAAKRAQDVLEWMLELHQQYGDPKMIPNVMMCTSIINAWAKNRDKEAPERAEALLRRMHEWHEAGNKGAKPNAITYNSVLKAWAKSRHPEAPQGAEAILRQMQEKYQAGDTDVRPDRVSYNSLLNAWANSSDPSAPDRAEYILRYMDDMYQAGDDGMKPDIIAFTTVIKAWANSEVDGAAERAEFLLRYMNERYRLTGDPDLAPNAVVYETVIDALVKSSAPDAAERAALLLGEILELQVKGHAGMKPKKRVYYKVLELLAKSPDKDAGFM